MVQVIRFKKNISTFSLTMTGLTSVIGSGWLLSTQKISSIAGPAGLLSWVVGMLVALLVSLFYVEIGSCYPSAGGIGYYSHITHGRFCGFITSWINWLSIVAVPPIEAQGIVQYLSQLTPTLQHWYDLPSHSLTLTGIGMAIILMFVFMFINYWSVHFFIKFNNFFTTIKILVPLLTIICLFYTGLHYENFGVHDVQTFAPFGWKSVFIGVIACGVVVAFNGFQSPLTFSEEIEHPKRMLPIAVIGTIIIAFFIYFLLQVVFIGSIDPLLIATGWNSINFRSPYVDLLLLVNFHLMALTIYATTAFSLGACGTTFVASSSRVLYSLSREEHFPAFLSKLHPVYHNPRYSIIACTLVGCALLFLFRGWYQMVTVISVLHIFSYVPAPIITLTNRLKFPAKYENKQQFKVPFGYILAPILLFMLSVLLFYAAWPLTGEMALMLLPGFLFYFYYEYKKTRNKNFTPMIKGASWLILYLLGISIVSFFGDNPSLGQNLISTPVSMILLAILSLATHYYGVHIAGFFEEENNGNSARMSNAVNQQ